MFAVFWSEHAHDQMQSIFDAHPELHTDLTYFLRRLYTDLNEKADRVGESRDSNTRIIFSGSVRVYVDADPIEKRAVVRDVKFMKRKSP